MRQSGSKFDRHHLRELGKRIRVLREAKGWSLKRLSINSDVSVAAIQKLESGAANPALLTVIAVIEALGESVDQIISAARKPQRSVSVVRGELPMRANGTVDLTAALADRRMRCSLRVLAAKRRLKKKEIPAASPLFAYVLDGELRLSFDDDRADHLTVGDSFHAAAETSAEWINPLSRRSLVLCIEDGADGEKN